jgi:thiamine pyrophosphokinase
MQTKTIAIVANGLIHDFKETAEAISHYDQVIAVDGGLNYCDRMAIVPHLIVGDCDSADPQLLNKYSHIPSERHPVDKDKTDLEIALEVALQPGVEKIGLFAALEKRTDHSLINLHLARRHPNIITIESDYETLFVINRAMEVTCTPGQTLSLMPIGADPTGVTTRGLKWELNNSTLGKDFFSLSNICLDNSFSITLSSGDILCCLVKRVR